MITTRQMSDAHEEFLAELIDGRICRGSGNQFHNQMDVRNDPRRDFHPLALDGKSTMGKSITITLDMIEKAHEQSHDVNPGFGLRWYHSETLRQYTDWVAVPHVVFADILADARAYRDLKKRALG